MFWKKIVCPLNGRGPEAGLTGRGWRCKQARKSKVGVQTVRGKWNAAVIKNK